MRYEPPIDRRRLVKAIHDVYGMRVEALAFVPVGFVAACFVLEGAGGERAFLKLWPELRIGEAAAERQYSNLALTRTLYDRDLYPRVPYPVRTRDGALWADFSGMPYAVFPLLPGEVAPDPLPAALREEFGRTIAVIHRATPALVDVLPPRESFDVGFEPALRRGLDVAGRIGPTARPGLRALREWVLSHRADILAQLGRLLDLRETVRRLDGPLVLCHTDLGGDNMLIDDEGRFSVLDWDDAIVAPPEYDLWSALGGDLRAEGFSGVLEGYREAGGAAPLHVEHFAFCLLRRYLGDTAARLERLLKEDTAGHEDDELLQGMDTWGVARWSVLDDTLAGVSAVLRQYEDHGR